jgi:putative ABC transport system permease protein
MSAGRPPAGPDEVVAGYPARLGARLPLASTTRTRMVTVVGIARPHHPIFQQSAMFLTDAEATALAGHPGRIDAIGLLAAPGFDITRVRAAASGAHVLTGAAAGRANTPSFRRPAPR